MNFSTVLGIIVVIFGGGIGITVIKVAFDMGKIVEKVGNIEKFMFNHYNEMKKDMDIIRQSFTTTTDGLGVQIGELRGALNAWKERNGK